MYRIELSPGEETVFRSIEELAVAILKDSPLDSTSLVQRVSQIVREMHADGTLTSLSDKWYGTDLTVVKGPAGR